MGESSIGLPLGPIMMRLNGQVSNCRRKRELMDKVELPETAKALIKRNYSSQKRDLLQLEASLVRLQKGKIKIGDQPSQEEWDVVWWHYGKRVSGF